MTRPKPDFIWKFQRLGGLDQPTLRTAAELTHLGELNPKLWVALSCPSSGLEFDPRTLALVDRDNDGRVRVPEILEAVSWLTARLANPEDMVDAPKTLALDRINAETPEGRRLLATARSVLATLGKDGATGITCQDVAEALKDAEGNTFNGDGVLPPAAEFADDEREFIKDALAVVGGVPDASGKPGVNAGIVGAFANALAALREWRDNVDHAETPLGADTAEAWNLLQALSAKIDDYFLRCDLAAFVPRAPADHVDNEAIPVPDHGLMDAATLEDLPLARIEPDRPFSFTQGINPAWRARVERLAHLAHPLLADPQAMTRDGWNNLKKALQPYEKALAQKPTPPPTAVTVPPTGSLDQLDADRVRAYLDSGVAERVNALIQKDADAPAASTDMADLERLVLYHAHLFRLLMNFVSFHDFYSLRHKAAFQYGTLYLDGRSCRLCLPVDDVARHANLAANSQLCLVYCDCRRKKDAPGEGEEDMSIVAAVTIGNADMLIEGRNGIFYDTAGRDWDATVTRVVSNPISIRQAVWDPYRRFARMLSEQIGKLAAAKQAGISKKLADAADETAAAKPPAPFDMGKSVGIFAAVGIALGALGTAAGSIAGALFSMAWWQVPLIFIGAFLLISGPSIVLAWLKLRKRTLGPLLEASGWAVNSRVPINFTLGRELTAIAQLPPNANRSGNDPLHAARKWPGVLLALALIAAGAAAAVWAWSRWPDIPFPWK